MSGLPAALQPGGRRATPAEFPSPGGLNLQAHSIPAERSVWAGWAHAVAGVRGARQRLAACEPQRRLPAAAPLGSLRAKSPRDRAGPAGGVDSAGVPGRFCLWILNYLGCCDGSVFSFRFLHLYLSGYHTDRSHCKYRKTRIMHVVTRDTTVVRAYLRGRHVGGKRHIQFRIRTAN